MGDERKDVDMENKEEEEKKDVDMDKKEEEEEEEEWEKEPPVVELTDEEKAKPFRPKATPDLTNSVMNLSFSKFSIPQKSEGFDEISFEWDTESKAQDYLIDWKKEQKLTCRIEDLVPGEWFKKTSAEWSKVLKGWQAKQKSVAKPKTVVKPKKEG